MYKNCCLFQDLETDPELFEATGDLQYDIYRLMREKIGKSWATFEPSTNVLWLDYIIDKLTSTAGVKYTDKNGAEHLQFVAEMLGLRQKLPRYRSTTEYVIDSSKFWTF